jgi:hypothetical protein
MTTQQAPKLDIPKQPIWRTPTRCLELEIEWRSKAAAELDKQIAERVGTAVDQYSDQNYVVRAVNAATAADPELAALVKNWALHQDSITECRTKLERRKRLN